MGDCDRDEAVVAEAVGELAVEGDGRGVGGGGLDLGQGVAAGGEVELVGLVGELGDAVEVDGLEGGDLGGHLERVEVLAVVGEGGRGDGALGVLLVGGGSGQIFRGEGYGFEVTGAVEDVGVVGWVGAKVGYGNTGDLGCDEGALGGVVVDEDEGVGAEVQLAGDGEDVVGFGLPVGFEGREVFELEDGVGVGEALSGGCLIVLGADGQQDAPVAQGEAVLLEGGEGLGEGGLAAKDDVVEAVVADDSAPEGVVEVEDQDLAREAVEGADDGGEGLGKGVRSGGGGVDPGAEPALRIEPMVKADAGGDGGCVVDVELSGRGAGEGEVEFVDETGGTAGQGCIEVAEEGGDRWLEVVLEDGAVKAFEQGRPDVLVAGELAFDVLGEEVFGGVEGREGLEIADAGVEVDEVRCEGDEGLGGVEGVGFVTAVVGLVEGGEEAGFEEVEVEERGELLRGAAAKDSDADGTKIGRGGEAATEGAALDEEVLGGEGAEACAHELRIAWRRCVGFWDARLKALSVVHNFHSFEMRSAHKTCSAQKLGNQRLGARP